MRVTIIRRSQGGYGKIVLGILIAMGGKEFGGFLDDELMKADQAIGKVDLIHNRMIREFYE